MIETEIELVGETILESELADYGYLSNKPTINEVPVVGDLTLEELGIQPAGEYALADNVPTKVSELENDAGYLTEINETDPHFHASPSSRITQEDIDNWNSKSEFSGNYDDLQNKPAEVIVPTKVSDLTNDKGFITKDEVDMTNYYNKTETDKMLEDVAKSSEIPDVSGFITSEEVDQKINAIPTPVLEEEDPTVPEHVKIITVEEIIAWNTGKNYHLPTASPYVKGGIMVGANLEIDEDGVLSAKASEGTFNYEELINVPTLNGQKLFGDKTSADYGIVNGVSSYNELTDTPTIPTKTSELTNDSNLIVGSNISNIVAISQADFDAIAEKDATTIYVIVG